MGAAGPKRAHRISPRWVDRPAPHAASRVALAGPFWRSKQARRSAPKPLEARREMLMCLVDGVDRILFSEALAAEGAIVFATACEPNFIRV
jgi:hypothetical protein